MIKKLFIILITMISCIAKGHEPKLNELLKANKSAHDESADNQKKLGQKKEEQAAFAALNNNSHTIIISSNDQKCQCAGLYGHLLIACMQCLSKEDLKKNFKKLSVRAAVYYLMNIVIDEYKEFLNYWSEEEWTEYWQQLGSEDQHRMPRTIQVQKDLIAQTYKSAADKSTSWYHSYYGRPQTYGTERWWKQVDQYQAFELGHYYILAREHVALKKALYKLAD